MKHRHWGFAALALIAVAAVAITCLVRQEKTLAGDVIGLRHMQVSASCNEYGQCIIIDSEGQACYVDARTKLRSSQLTSPPPEV